MNIFDNTLTKEKCELLLKACHGKVPIKVEQAGMGRNARGHDPHWAKGVMTGIKGIRVIWRPLNNHFVDEMAPMDRCKLWKSRMNQSTIDKVIEIERSLKPVSETQPLEPKPDMTTLPSFDDRSLADCVARPFSNPVNAFNNTFKTMPESTPLPEAVKELRQPDAMVKPELSFEEKLRQFIQLKDEIYGQAEATLQKLQQDRLAAVEMLDSIDRQITEVKKLIPQKVPPIKPKTFFPKPQGKRAYWADRLLKFMKENPDRWMRTGDIRKGMNFTWAAGNFSGIYNPLVAGGVLEKRGGTNFVELRYVPSVGV